MCCYWLTYFITGHAPSATTRFGLLIKTAVFGLCNSQQSGPTRGEEKRFPGLLDVWVPRRRSKILKRVLLLFDFKYA